MRQRPDLRTLLIMLMALAIGLSWAGYSLASTEGVRNETTVRALVWAIVAGPAALFAGWLAARRAELGLAGLACFCLYFFPLFVAQQIEALALGGAARAGDHIVYYSAVLIIHGFAGAGLAWWRALSPPMC